ncbi:IS3 family transposase [Paucibacter sp. AS339]
MVVETTQKLSAKIVEIAQVRQRFGYRRIRDLLGPHFLSASRKRIYRLYN